MVEKQNIKKEVIVHIGPHKTGSTAIQHCLTANKSVLAKSGILFLHDEATHEASLHLSRENFDAAEAKLRDICKMISAAAEEVVLLSQEDFSGDLIGRSRKKNIYPKLTRNLRIINRSFGPHNVRFVFFVRDEEGWLTSCYHQNLKHRTQFSTFDDFLSSLNEKLSWEKKLEKPKEFFGEKFISINYSKDPSAGTDAILKLTGKEHLSITRHPFIKNASPSKKKIDLLERVNALSSFKATAWFSKTLIVNGYQPRPFEYDEVKHLSISSDLARLALPALTRRAESRISQQDAEDILPPEDVDLSKYVFKTLPADVQLPEISRYDIRNQSKILDYHFRSKSQLAKLNALLISYLRRDTAHTAKARSLFLRVWKEHGIILINELTTRWLISTLQTFLDHGANNSQRIIGASGHFYANLMKIYEGERSIEGLEQDAIYESSEPLTKNKFTGLDRYKVGGTDLLLNTNALALDLAMRDDVAGIVLIELLLRVKSSANVFTRMDRTRKEKGISVHNFEDTWSFFDPR